ncbi:MAG TPA: 4'-phosphopantetheinyl transferase superfamily protein [Terriglobia bacterium]|nr:4'-phosphopantetheinyl transferase superfamily protein [Terriglobia bacterium]
MGSNLEAPVLKSEDAHVWQFQTDISADQCAGFRNLLSKEENARADRFVFESDRLRFIGSHGRLRMILGSYCSTDPKELVFATGSHGKPFLMEPSVPIQFNLSHSGNLAAIVVTSNIRCGIDIEKIRPEVSDRAIAERFFCKRENEWLQCLPEAQRIQGFYRLWSVKESILKADGKGLSIPLSDIDTSDVLSRNSSVVALSGGNPRLSLWVEEVPADEGYTCALAVEGAAPKIRVLQGCS